MGRTAEYSIKGYLYQFLRYLSELLAASDDALVTIEGSIEDIDVSSTSLTRAVQCKYHEQADKFTLGKIYKPILLMLEHFGANPNPAPRVDYHLFCHFPDKSGALDLTVDDLEQVLSTTAIALKPIVARIVRPIDLKSFLAHLTVEFGPSVDTLQEAVVSSLQALGFTLDDVRAVIYPAAFQRIVDISTQPTAAGRSLTRTPFVEELRRVKHVTFTRWTRELSTRKQIYLRLRRNLKSSLDFNSRRRFFVIDPANITAFEADIVLFIKAFVEKYSFKLLHDDPPLFAIAGNYDVYGIVTRLHDRGILCTTGLIGAADFRKDHLFRKPMIAGRRGAPVQMEFRVRIANLSQIGDIDGQKPDDLFQVNAKVNSWNIDDVSVYSFEIEHLSDLEYIFQLRSEL